MSIDKEPLELNADFQYALDLLEKEGRSMFITGKAGTGKSTLLQLFRQTTRRKAVVVAPTGIAALNVKGQTIHSFFGFPPRPLNPHDIKKRRDRKLYQKLETLVIDEISMVRADMLDNIDYFLRINRDNLRQPFGGVQVVFFGDMFQLPPVLASDVETHLMNSRYDTPYFFSARVFQDGYAMEMLELRKVYRQENRHFLRLLDDIRLNRLDSEDLATLNERHVPNFDPPEYYITLSTRNARVDSINRQKLDAIPLQAKGYTARVTGDFPPHLFPAELALSLKPGAQVMFVKNDPQRRFVNGTIGTIEKLESGSATVRVEDRSGQYQYIEVEPVDWDVVRYKLEGTSIETETIGTFTQLPLRLAWAITIHKSQGQTFDKVIIDLDRGAFEFGQTYVALSRCRTLEGIVLRQPIQPRDIMTDERIIAFYEKWNQ